MDRVEPDFVGLRLSLESRRTLLNGGNEHCVERLIEETIKVRPDVIVSRMFKHFDGFPPGAMDGASCIRLWPLGEVLSSVHTAQKNLPRIVFGDFLISSEFLTLDISDSSRPVRYDFDGPVLADSFAHFLRKLAGGEFDFL